MLVAPRGRERRQEKHLAKVGQRQTPGHVTHRRVERLDVVDHRLQCLQVSHDGGGELLASVRAPQAWAAGAVFMMLAASLGVEIDAPARRISFSRGRLPDSIDWLRLTDLKVGDAHVDLQFERHPHDLGVTIIRREGDVEIVTVK